MNQTLSPAQLAAYFDRIGYIVPDRWSQQARLHQRRCTRCTGCIRKRSRSKISTRCSGARQV
ncbi:MAG: hypothetical protein CBARDMAM_2435 [uncultured Caballeronia sp.]|nr:MAG: hypothetical protein CBARDMAM_2435 [uncultured Caballeronia sp.]